MILHFASGLTLGLLVGGSLGLLVAALLFAAKDGDE